jgi:hypothetical protein
MTPNRMNYVKASSAACVTLIPVSYGRQYTCPKCGNTFLCLNTGPGGVGGENVWVRMTFTNQNCT